MASGVISDQLARRQTPAAKARPVAQSISRNEAAAMRGS